MAKPLTWWLVLSFSQHNLRLVVSWRYLHVSVTKYQDKFASLRQVNSPNSWDKFQICCADMYLIRFPLNFAVFRVFLWISRLRSFSKYRKPCTYELRHLHFTNWPLKICIWRLYFSGWSPKGDLEIFLISSPVLPYYQLWCTSTTFWYTVISRKVVRKTVHATIPKGNMGYDQYTVADIVAVEPTFVAFL